MIDINPGPYHLSANAFFPFKIIRCGIDIEILHMDKGIALIAHRITTGKAGYLDTAFPLADAAVMASLSEPGPPSAVVVTRNVSALPMLHHKMARVRNRNFLISRFGNAI